MADNGFGNGPVNGDILSALAGLSGDVTLIRSNTSDIRDNTAVLTNMDRNISAILQGVGRWSQQDARSRIYDTVNSNNNRGGANDPYTRRPGNNLGQYGSRRTGTRRSGSGNIADEFIDSFFEEMEKEMFGGLKGAMQQNMKDFAAAMGMELRDLPSAFGKALADQVKQTGVAKNISDRVNGAITGLLDRSMQGMRRGVNRYYDRATANGQMSQEQANQQRSRWSDVINQMTDNFRNRRTTFQNDPTPGRVDDAQNGNNQPAPSPPEPAPENNEDVQKVLEDKLQYLYPIYNTLTTINEGVRLIANAVSGDTEGLSGLQDMFDNNNQNNSNFLDDLLGNGQGGGADDLLGGAGDALGGAGEAGAGGLAEAGGAEAAAGAAGAEGAVGAAGMEAGAGLMGVAEGAASACPYILAAIVALKLADKALDAFKDCFKPLQESFENLKKTLSNITNRYFVSEKQKIKDQTERLTADINEMVKTPFDILNQAAQEWYDAWDNNLKTINATQGYTKADLQSLMSSYAERLRTEGLGSVVSATEVSDNLAKVLESGLSGRAAEEFAYLATVLQNAIPTQDFFSYADTYAAIAANQIAAGKSQAEALEAANAQLTQFASNLLYSSRELSGGFGTGLKDAGDLLSSAVQIANTAGVGDSSYISAALTAISSTVGAVAPDLASSVTDAIIDAALGGNSDQLVALRSLANTGASNTSFLKAFARDPKGVLQTLFTNIAKMQNLNNANFMEVAENLSETFGMSLGAFARIDFDMVANAVSAMSVSMNSLDQNVKLLQEGETTTTAEQLKMQKINEMILNEGLSYVLDNQAARMIQQHMWDQELAAELQETTYGVELQGSALEFLSSIKETINNILNFLNPFSWLNKIASIFQSGAEVNGLKNDIKAVLEAGKVGQGNAESLYNLTTYDVDRLTNKPGNLAELMTGRSSYRTANAVGKLAQAGLTAMFGGNLISSLGSTINSTVNALTKLNFGLASSSSNGMPSSQYDFATKGLYSALQNNRFNGGPGGRYGNQGVDGLTATPLSSTQSTIASKAANNMQGFLDTMEASVEANQSYANWAKTARNFGITNLSQALAPYGLTEADLEGKYQEYQASKASEYDYNKDADEKDLRDKLRDFMDNDLTQFFEDVISRMDTQIEFLTSIDTNLTEFKMLFRIGWLQLGWNEKWLKGAWQNDWLDTAWRTEWLENAWNTDWIQDAWGQQWLQNAWRNEWINGAWRTEWLQDAWRDSWLNQAWGEQWLENAWKNDWIDTAWRKEWLEGAWATSFLLMWKTQWLNKAWKQDWLQKAWSTEWLQKAWSKSWLEEAWGTDWLQDAWKTQWLQDAWNKSWLTEAWGRKWLSEAWQEQWIDTSWSNDWLKEAWQTSWLDNAWGDEWLKKRWDDEFVTGLVKSLWGNRWYEFFNIFKDRFGGITTSESDGLTSGRIKVDTEGLYKIYSAETGKAAEAARKEVQQADETGDAILALTKQLTQNTVDLRDPQVQTNVLLSQILIVLEAIMQAENTAGGASLATTLAALGMGLTTPNIANGEGVTV